MKLTTIDEAASELGTTVDGLLIAVLERQISRPSKVFGWTSDEYQRVRDEYAAWLKTPRPPRQRRTKQRSKGGNK